DKAPADGTKDAGVKQDAAMNMNNGDSGMLGASACPVSYFSNTGCINFMDMTAQNQVTITFFKNNMFVFDPKCIKITKGTTVTFNGFESATFFGHPLKQGCGADTTITSTSTTDTSKAFVFNTVGDYGYYCNFHGSAANGTGMAGMIQVIE